LFQRAGPDSLQNVVPGLPLQHDAVDAASIEDVRQK
jgi:hypothetical protein